MLVVVLVRNCFLTLPVTLLTLKRLTIKLVKRTKVEHSNKNERPDGVLPLGNNMVLVV